MKAFEVAEVPVRCVRFIPRKNWFVAGSDDFQLELRVFDYNTHEKVTAFGAHPDYIRCLAVHPSLRVVLTGCDDMTIKAWDWDKQWKCIRVFEGITHCVMGLAFNPKDTNTFASSCLDRSVKTCSLGTLQSNFTLEAHEKGGVNYVEFYAGADKPYFPPRIRQVPSMSEGEILREGLPIESLERRPSFRVRKRVITPGTLKLVLKLGRV